MSAPWTVLGFKWDDVVGSWQDQRLARVADVAWRAEGCPAAFRIEQSAGTGEILINWYVNAAAAELLDRHAFPWRQFIVGTRERPPEDATLALGGSGEDGSSPASHGQGSP